MEHSLELPDISPEREYIIAATMARLALQLENADLPPELRAEKEQRLDDLTTEQTMIAVRRASLERRYHSHAA